MMNWEQFGVHDRGKWEFYAKMKNKTTPIHLVSVDGLIEFSEVMSAGYRCFQWLARLTDDPILGAKLGDCFWAHVPGKLHASVVTSDPENTQLLNQGLDFCVQKAKEIDSNLLEFWGSLSEPLWTEQLTLRGARLVQKVPISRLNLQEFDWIRWQTALEKVQSNGIRITTATELEAENFDWLRGCYEALLEIRADIPSPDPITHPSYEETIPLMLNNKLEDMFFAVDGDRIVGYSRLSNSHGDPSMLETGLSGTVRSHRRRGIVTALKVKSLTDSKNSGRKWVQTNNEENNPMLKLNIALGFKEVDVSLCYHLTI